VLTLAPLRDAALARRTAVSGLVAAAAAVVTGCTPRGIDRRRRPTPSPSPTPDEDPDVTLAATVLREEQRVLGVVLATLEQHPAEAATLAGARTAHQAHVDLLTDAVPHGKRTSTASPSEGDSPSEEASVSAAPPAVPRRAGPALMAVAREEDRLSLLGRRSAFAAESGAFARVLGSMAAAAAQQSTTLSTTARDRR
jgi:hypothetical protein